MSAAYQVGRGVKLIALVLTMIIKLFWAIFMHSYNVSVSVCKCVCALFRCVCISLCVCVCVCPPPGEKEKGKKKTKSTAQVIQACGDLIGQRSLRRRAKEKETKTHGNPDIVFRAM